MSVTVYGHRAGRKRNIALSEDFDGIYNEPVFTDTGQSGMYESLMELNQKYRQPLYLYYYEELSIKEIAKVLRISETSVTTRLQRGRQKIREKMGRTKK